MPDNEEAQQEPAEHYVGKSGCRCAECRAFFLGWSHGHSAGLRDAVYDRKPLLAAQKSAPSSPREDAP